MIKGLFNFIFGLVRLAFFLVLIGLIFHTWVIKQTVTLALSYQLGAEVSARGVKMDWKNTGFEIQGLEIGNPYDFPRGLLADIPLVIVSADLPSVFRGVLRLKTVGIDVRGLQVMNVPQKGLNILALKSLQRSSEERTSASRAAIEAKMKKYMPAVSIDELILSVGDIKYLDMSGPSLRQSHYKAGIRGATYYNICTTHDLIAILVGETLKKMGLGYLEAQYQRLQSRSISSAGEKRGFFSRLAEVFGGDASH